MQIIFFYINNISPTRQNIGHRIWAKRVEGARDGAREGGMKEGGREGVAQTVRGACSNEGAGACAHPVALIFTAPHTRYW
jgi:hypothetical protein